jgi:hypothetical protein
MQQPDGGAASLIVLIIVLTIAMACFQVGATQIFGKPSAGRNTS